MDYLRSEAPLVLRATPGALYLVGGAAGPLAGDDLTLTIDVGPGARLTVHSTAAALCLPGGTGKASRFRIVVTVAEEGSLHWLPEPTIAGRECLHHIDVEIALAPEARLVWREEAILGRHGEAAGELVSMLRVDRAGRPLLRQKLALGGVHPGWSGPAVCGEARAVGCIVAVDPDWDPAKLVPTLLTPPVPGANAALLPLSGAAQQITATAPDAPTLRRLLAAGLRLAAARPRSA
ncbi:MAG: urease accessory protein UreD [Acidimicrobiales bacterium]